MHRVLLASFVLATAVPLGARPTPVPVAAAALPAFTTPVVRVGRDTAGSRGHVRRAALIGAGAALLGAAAGALVGVAIDGVERNHRADAAAPAP